MATKSLKALAAILLGIIQRATNKAESFTKSMTKAQKKWYDLGYSDQIYAKENPEALLQTAWIYLLKDIDNGSDSWLNVFSNFPSYKKGALKATKDLNLNLN